jgi:hypothetical protein
MPSEEEVKQALRDAGEQLKSDLWKPGDEAFLAARAKDLIGLNLKAAAATDPAKKKAYHAAALDVLSHVKLLAVIRMETAAQHVLDALGKFFMTQVLPLVAKLLPAVFAAL